MYYVVLRKDLLSLFDKRSSNPSENEIKSQIEGSRFVYLLSSLDDAKKVADAMFSAPRSPKSKKSSGQYGLIVQVAVTLEKNLKFEPTNLATMVNNGRGYHRAMELSDISIQSALIREANISKVLSTHITTQAKSYNSNLENTDYVKAPSSCLLL